MESSESIVNIAKSIFKFQSKIGKISKDAVNPFFKNRYASLANILDNINEHLIDSSLIVIQNPGSNSDNVNLETILMHSETGEYMSSNFEMMPAKKDPQGIGSCITYMRRYALSSILKLNVDDDDDGNYSSNITNKNRNSGKTRPNNHVYSDEFKEIKDDISKCYSIDDLYDIVDRIRDTIKSEAEKQELRKLYIEKKAIMSNYYS